MVATVDVARGQSTQLVSDASSAPLGFWTNSESATISGDARWVAFESKAPVLGGTSGEHVYVYERPTSITELVSRATGANGVAGNGLSWLPEISPDGRYVVFIGDATNLVAMDTNSRMDVFLRDRMNQTTERVNLRNGGTLQSAFGTTDTGPAMSSDARYIVFTNDGNDLEPIGMTLLRDRIYVRDRATNSTVLASVDPTGGEPNGNSDDGDISANGRYVTYDSSADDLVPNDTNFAVDIFVCDLLSPGPAFATTRVSRSSTGVQSNGDSCCPAISADGRYVAFESFANNLVSPATAANRLHVYRHDRMTGATILLSTGFTGQGNDDSDEPRPSTDGRYVAFTSLASNLVANDTNNKLDVFIRDCVANTTTRVSLTDGGAPTGGAQTNHHSAAASISADGGFISFLSLATNLVSTPMNIPSAVINVYTRGPLLASAPVSFCTAGTTTNGCSASISASAQPRVNHGSQCQISVTNVEGQKTGILFYGLDTLPQPWCSMGGGTSFLCLKPPTMRASVQSSGGASGACNGTLALDWNAFQIANPAALGAPWIAGETSYVQSWFRDPPACKTTSLSNALELIYTP